jgi:Raf kinase inhibitor-like YbhB/YbcL family protein
MTMLLTSPAFSHQRGIPARYTCDDDDLSPPLEWSGVPAAAASLALIVDDPDAPDPEMPRMTWVHWVLYNIPVSAGGLRENIGHDLPAGTQEGLNDWKKTGYGGPCPPIGRHRYFFKLYALDAMLPNLGPKATKKDLEAAMRGHVIEWAELVGTYQKSASPT